MSNGNERGSSHDRRKRKEWLLHVYASNVKGCCRCYKCGGLLTVKTLTVDRIIPGVLGGGYTHNNIRPACLACNSADGHKYGKGRKQ